MTQKRTVSAAELLRDLRTKQGTSLRSAASDIGIAPSYLSRLERGERPVGGDVAQRLALYYGLGSDDAILTEQGIPSDVVEILKQNPDLLEQIRNLRITRKAAD